MVYIFTSFYHKKYSKEILQAENSGKYVLPHVGTSDFINRANINMGKKAKTPVEC